MHLSRILAGTTDDSRASRAAGTAEVLARILERQVALARSATRRTPALVVTGVMQRVSRYVRG